MRQDVDKDTFGPKKTESDWQQPKISAIPINRDEIERITNAPNPKRALREFYRQSKDSHPK